MLYRKILSRKKEHVSRPKYGGSGLFSNDKFFPKGNKKKIIFLVAILGVMIFGISRTNLLKINKINVDLKNASCVNSEVLKNDLNLIGKYPFLHNEKLLEQKILTKYHCIKEVQFHQNTDRSVNVNIVGREAFIKLVFLKAREPLIFDKLESTPSSSTALLDWSQENISEKFYIADEAGVIFGEEQRYDLPLLLYPVEDLKPGQHLSVKLFEGLKIITTGLKEYGISLIENTSIDPNLRLKILNDDLMVFSKPRLIFSLQEDLLRQLASLQLILQKAKIDGKEVEIIDLRFDKPVVVYSPVK